MNIQKFIREFAAAFLPRGPRVEVMMNAPLLIEGNVTHHLSLSGEHEVRRGNTVFVIQYLYCNCRESLSDCLQEVRLYRRTKHGTLTFLRNFSSLPKGMTFEGRGHKSVVVQLHWWTGWRSFLV